MEKLRKFYLPIVHFLCLGLLIYILGTDLFVKRPYGGLNYRDYDQIVSSLSFRVFNDGGGVDPHEAAKYSMENRSLIVYTLLAIYLGSGYLLFKKS
jgi:hypothetical protein